jgi:N-acetylglucosaminyldiphosphoundecaprenol N-acetyl-beta-D-mannosaminyltransferase
MAFLGGKEGVANQAAECLKKEFPHLKIEGTWDGAEADAILKARQPKISSDLFLVALGHPKQERWIAANLSRLEVKVAIGVGGAFDYLVGHPKRAPIFVRRLGLEWVWRLLREPKRLGRILTAFPYFPLLVFWRKIIRDNA